MHKTYYEMLGVSRDADSTTIKNAFRKLAKAASDITLFGFSSYRKL